VSVCDWWDVAGEFLGVGLGANTTNMAPN